MVKIQVTKMLDGRTICSAWEPSTITGIHGTITTIDGEWYGRIGTDPDAWTYQCLPVGEDRSAAVERAYQTRYAVAYTHILRAHPEVYFGVRDMGEIVVS